MIVSQFELLFKPQAPGPAAGAAVARVVQGYFLEITNLENKEYLYEVLFTMAPPTPALVDRSLAGNTIYFVDTPPGTDNQSGVLNGGIASSTFSLSKGFVRIPAQGTALLAVLPSIFGSAFDPTPLTTPDFEVRGYVTLKLPALFPPFPPFGFRRLAQATAPVKVLLTAQNRATFFSASNEITGQIQATLPLASGAAAATVPPEPGGFIVFTPVDLGEKALPLRDALTQIDAPPTDLLAVLLSGLDPASTQLAAYNESLARAKIPFSVQRLHAEAG